VEPLLHLGLSHVPEGDSEERVRLKSIEAGWPFAFPEAPMTEAEGLDRERIGLEAAEMALRLGMHDLASGAYDAAVGYAASRGLYARSRAIEERRLDLLPELGDPLEIGDAYAALAWAGHELGRFEEGLERAEEGLRQVGAMLPSAQVHLVSWESVIRYRLGDWDGALASLDGLRQLLDERRDDPPYFAAHAFAVGGIIAERRGDTVESDRLAGLLLPLAQSFSARLLPWLVILLVERDDLGPARELLNNLPPAWRVHTAEVLEARCEFVAAAGAWDQVPALTEEARAYSAASEALPPSIHADRLEGRAALASGDSEAAVKALTRAVEGFDRLRTPYDAARTSVDLAEALIASGRTTEVPIVLDRTAATFEQLRATKAQELIRKVQTNLEG